MDVPARSINALHCESRSAPHDRVAVDLVPQGTADSVSRMKHLNPGATSRCKTVHESENRLLFEHDAPPSDCEGDEAESLPEDVGASSVVGKTHKGVFPQSNVLNDGMFISDNLTFVSDDNMRIEFHHDVDLRSLLPDTTSATDNEAQFDSECCIPSLKDEFPPTAPSYAGMKPTGDILPRYRWRLASESKKLQQR